MKKYLEERNQRIIGIMNKMMELRDSEIKKGGPNAGLFTEVVSELSYRVADDPDFGSLQLCPKCETPIPKDEYDHYCGFCGQFIRK